MNTKHILVLMAAALMMAGCAFDDPMEKQKPWVETDPNALVPVKFSVSTENSVDFTRALTSIVTYDAGEYINVRVKPMGEENYTPYIYTTAGSGQNNVALTAPNPQPYFPSGINSTVEAYAYYPSTALSEPTFTVKDDQSTDANYKASDLMMAPNRTIVKITDPNDPNYGDGSTLLTMKHLMTQLRINAVPGEHSGINITGIQVEARKSVTFTPESATDTKTETVGDLGTVVVREGAGEGYVIIPPQNIGDVKIKIITGNGTDSEIATYAFAASGNFLAGGSYSVDITVVAGQLGMTTAIANWNGMGSVIIAPNGNLVIDPIPAKSYIDEYTPVTLILEGEGQELFVRKGTTLLRYGADKDYTVQFLNNTVAGTAYVVVTGQGEEYEKCVAVAPFTITPDVATISYGQFTTLTKTYGDEPFIHNHLYDSSVGKPGHGIITYTSSNTEVATVDDNGQVTIVKPGETVITATAHDGANYTYDPTANTASYTLTVNKAAGSISFETAEPTKSWSATTTDNTFTQEVTHTGNAEFGKAEVTYSVPAEGENNTCGATINAATGKVTFTKGGSVVVTATVEDNDYYTYAEKTATYTLTVGKAEGYIHLSGTSANVNYDATYPFSVTSTHGGDVTAASDDTDIATVTATPTDGTLTITAKGAGTTKIIVTCAATAQYQEAKAEFIVNVGKIAITDVTAPTAVGNLVYTGSALTLVNAGSATNGTMKYSLTNSENEEDWSTTPPTRTDAGTYAVFWKVKGDNNHIDYNGTPIYVIIAKADPTYTAPTAISNLTYSGSQLALVTAGSVTGGTMQYRLSETANWSNNIPTAAEAKDYTVYWQVKGDNNHNDYVGSSVSVTIGKASAGFTTEPTLRTGLVYNGAQQDLVNAGIASHGSIEYSIDNGVNWSGTPKGINADTYTVYYRVTSNNSNYNNTDKTRLGEVKIAKKNVESSEINLDSKTLTYNGSSQTQDVVDVAGLSASGNWSVTGNTGTNARDYTLTVTMADGCQNYTGSATKTWSINPKALSSTEFKFASSSISKTYIWDIGTSSNALTMPDGCTVEYSSNNDEVASVNSSTGVLTPGGTVNATATITATATGNYSGTASYTISATNKVKEFSYTGTIQSIAVCPGRYKLEAWGAQGGSYYATGGLGGYDCGTWTCTATTNVYVGVGGCPGTTTGAGYNGGGAYVNASSQVYKGGGGGGTHIAYGSTNRGVMSNYSSYTDELLVIAGGGGGGAKYLYVNLSTNKKMAGGAGGGKTIGEVMHQYGDGDVQITTGITSATIGQGGNACGSGYRSGAYQEQSSHVYSGSGGTGYAKSGLTDQSHITGNNSGNGKARITWVGN